MIIKKESDPKKEEEIDKLKDEFLELQQTVSDYRKQGKNTQIAQLLTLEIPAKIKIASITQEDKDINLLKKEVSDLKKEVSELTTGSDFDHMNDMIKEAFEHLRRDEKKSATEKYNEIMKIYPLLTKSLKKTVYSACIELRERLSGLNKTEK